MAVRRWLHDPRMARLFTFAILAGLAAFHAANNWLWLHANETMLGWDVPSHLGTSYIYNYMLRPLTLKSLFATVVWHPNRPPLPFLSAVPLYRLFGVSPDVGTMFNVLYLAVLLGSVYGIGRQLGGRRVGLLAAFVVATLPMIYVLSRFFYLELALTAMVALSIYLLLASDGFEHRTLSLLFGLSFGLGLLTKRTYPAFLVAPVCLVVARSAVMHSLQKRLRAGRRLRPFLRDALLAAGVGLILAAIWYFPSREIANQLLLGAWLLPMWAVLIATTVYLIRLRAGPDSNFLAAIFLGATFGSLWYLPRITFVPRLLSMGFGVNDPRERSAGLDTLATYFYFPARLASEHLSLVTFGLLLVAVAGLLLYLVRSGSIGDRLRRANNAWWVTTLWVVAAYLIFTFSIYRKSRGLAPVLPALALILAAGLFRLPWRRVVAVLVVLVVVWGFVQFFVLSYSGPHLLADRTAFTLPIVGETGLFARGGTIQLPASGDTDPGYWVAPELMQFVETERQAVGADSVRVGVLVNNEHVNPDLLGLLSLQSYPGVQILNLASTESRESVYPRLFEQDYLLLIDGDYMLLDTAAQKALDHLQDAPGFFNAVFELAQQVPLPNGDTVLLYRKVRRPGPGYDVQEYRSVATAISSLERLEDGILLVPGDQADALAGAYSGNLPPYLWPGDQPLDSPGIAQALEALVKRHPVLFVLFRDEGAVDPEHRIEGWLDEHAYRARSEWFDGVRWVVYGAPAPRAVEIEHPVDLQLGPGIRLLGYMLVEESVEPGRPLRLTLFWQTDEPLAERLTVFAHLLDRDGRLVAQFDSEPAGGSRPTNSWSPGEVIRDQRGILVPPDALPGEYRLVVGLYQPDSGERLTVSLPGQPGQGGAEAEGDAGAGEDQILLEDARIVVQRP